MTLSQIRREVNALKRKYAKALAVVRLRRLAQEFCEDWEANGKDDKPVTNSIAWGQWFIKRGYRPRSFNGLFDCIRRCTDEKEAPLPVEIVKALIPWPWGKYRTIIDNVFRHGFLSQDRPPRRAPDSRRISPADITPAFPIMAQQDLPWPIGSLSQATADARADNHSPPAVWQDTQLADKLWT